MADNKGLTVKKNENFSEWFTEVVQKAELADMRFNVKGFLVFQPNSVTVMEKMYDYMEKSLRRKGHKPYWFPTLIPESNFKKESSHISGFTPEAFWVTQGGEKELEERLALRPTSETAFYQMFAMWIRSYKDLPFKTYQRAQVFRCETKATRPFLRSREFHWIETHCAFANQEDALKQVYEDMQTSKEVLHDIYGLPFIIFERPAWDVFPGASRTFAADVLNPDGKVVQQPSTHLIKHEFAKAFDIKYKDKDGTDKYVYTTCYGPAISRIFASVVIVHGDDKGLRFPWEISPYHIAIVPIGNEDKLLTKAKQLEKELSSFCDVLIDTSEKSPGEKFNTWELRGVPIRIDLGMKELESKKLSLFRRDLNKREAVAEKDLVKHIEAIRNEFTANLIKEADKVFANRIVEARTLDSMKKAIDDGNIVRCNFCSTGMDGLKCAEAIKEKTGAEVRGTNLEEEKVEGKCIICSKPAKKVVYVARSY